MYRQYLNNSLDMSTLRSTNLHAPEGVKYCNGFCQDFRNRDVFTGPQTLCNECKNLLNLAIKKIKNEEITLEQFKANTRIVYGEVAPDTTTTKQQCKTCKEIKSSFDFEANRKKCKACRAIQSTNRNDAVNYIQDIENLKTQLNNLETYVKNIPKDILIKVISHYKIGRKATDTKIRMVFNTVEHFRQQLNPKLCLGRCGKELPEENTTCAKCEQKKFKKPVTAILDLVEFENNIHDFVANLQEISIDQNYLYNHKKIVLINKELKAGTVTGKNKNEIIQQINEAIRERKENKRMKEAEEHKLK